MRRLLIRQKGCDLQSQLQSLSRWPPFFFSVSLLAQTTAVASEFLPESESDLNACRRRPVADARLFAANFRTLISLSGYRSNRQSTITERIKRNANFDKLVCRLQHLSFETSAPPVSAAHLSARGQLQLIKLLREQLKLSSGERRMVEASATTPFICHARCLFLKRLPPTANHTCASLFVDHLLAS